MPRHRSFRQSTTYTLLVLTPVVLWWAGWMPDWVYQGRLRDEVLQRSGVDLADRSAIEAAKVQVRQARGVTGPVPAVDVEFENTGNKPLTEFQVFATFRPKGPISMFRPEPAEPRSSIVHVAGFGEPPLLPGERRRVRLRSDEPYDPRTPDGDPAGVVADLTWTGAAPGGGLRRLVSPPNKASPLDRAWRKDTSVPDASGLVVRPWGGYSP